MQLIKKKLKTSGLKSTNQRLAILKILSGTKKPLTAEEIFNKLATSNIPINLSTIYRTLEKFVELNLVTKLLFSFSDKVFFELEGMQHNHYLICKKCFMVCSISHCPLAEYERQTELTTGFTIDEHKLYLYGTCNNCQNPKL